MWSKGAVWRGVDWTRPTRSAFASRVPIAPALAGALTTPPFIPRFPSPRDLDPFSVNHPSTLPSVEYSKNRRRLPEATTGKLLPGSRRRLGPRLGDQSLERGQVHRAGNQLGADHERRCARDPDGRREGAIALD